MQSVLWTLATLILLLAACGLLMLGVWMATAGYGAQLLALCTPTTSLWLVNVMLVYALWTVRVVKHN